MAETWSAATLYRAVWRWHFYAGLVCAPFLLVLAVTGAIYLFNDEINDLVYPHLRLVPATQTEVPLRRVAAAVSAAYPGGTVTRIDTPAAPGRSMQVFLTPPHGEALRVFVDPGTGKVLGAYVYSRTLVGFADVAHGSLMLGDFGDGIVELAACWGFILTLSGLYLWWPRLPGAPVARPRRGVKGRMFWKDWHSVIGMWIALLVLFLILTGLPWATFWGGLFRAGTDFAGIGYPTSHGSHGAASQPLKAVTEGAVPWTLETAPALQSAPAGHHAGMHHAAEAPSQTGPVGLDEVAAILAAQGMPSPYRLSLPKDDEGSFVAVVYPDQPEGQRTLSIDQYSGAVLEDVRFADYGVAAKAVELGVQLHMGNYFGRLNQIVMLMACLGIAFLCISGPIMWWRRRPQGALAAPRPIAAPTARALAIIVIAMGAIFPLAGASLLCVLMLDLGLRRFGRATAPAARADA